ncbi:MAG: hypothetical protein U0166_17490 [Acidobacteriota bacterium]
MMAVNQREAEDDGGVEDDAERVAALLVVLALERALRVARQDEDVVDQGGEGEQRRLPPV